MLALACQTRTREPEESEEDRLKLGTCLDNFAKAELNHEPDQPPYYATSYCFSELNTAQFLRFLSRADLDPDPRNAAMKKNAAIEKYTQLHNTPLFDWQTEMVPLLEGLAEWAIDKKTISLFPGEDIDHHLNRPKFVLVLDQTRLYREETYERVMDAYLEPRLDTLLPSEVSFYARQYPYLSSGNRLIRRYAEAMQQAGRFDWPMVVALNRALLEYDSPGYDGDTDRMNIFLIRSYLEPRMDTMTPAKFLWHAALVRWTAHYNLLLLDYAENLKKSGRYDWETVKLLTTNLREVNALSYPWDSKSLNDQFIVDHAKVHSGTLSTDQFLGQARGIKDPISFNWCVVSFALSERGRLNEDDRSRLLAALREPPSYMGLQFSRSTVATQIETIFTEK